MKLKSKVLASMSWDGYSVTACELCREDIDNMLSMNVKNRPLNSSRVDKLKRDLASGMWKFNGATIVIDGNGELIDGQHRLTVLKRAGYPITTQLVVELNSSGQDATDVQKTIDTGMMRTYAQALCLSGVKHYTLKAAIARQIASLSHSGVGNVARSDMDKVIETYSKEMDHFCCLRRKGAFEIPAPALAAACIVAKKYQCHDRLFFFLRSVQNLDMGNTLNGKLFGAFLNKVKKSRGTGEERQIYILTSSFNCFKNEIDGVQMKQLRAIDKQLVKACVMYK